MRKKMYELLDTKTKKRQAEHDYNTLRAARKARRVHNRGAEDPLRYIVVPGPDHPKYKAD